MPRYKLSFSARHKGAIGALSNFVETVEALDVEGAWFSLYDRYEHIGQQGVEGIPSTEAIS